MEKSLKSESLNAEYEAVHDSFDAQLGFSSKPQNPQEPSGWMADAFPGYVIAEFGNVYYKIPYARIEANDITTYVFSDRSQWSEVERKIEWEEIVKSMKAAAEKIGARNNKNDLSDIQSMHDISTKLGASCGSKSIDPEETMVSFGKAVKATQLENGDVKLGGYLVTFSDENNPDIDGDFFTKNTDFGDADKSSGWFNHCLPLKYNGKSLKYTSQLPDVTLTKDDTGVFAEIVLGSRNKYEKLLADLGVAGKLGWSSGTAPNLITEKPHKNGSHEITRWKLGLDASLTPMPAEPKNMVVTLKSISDEFADFFDSEAEETAEVNEPAVEIKSIKEIDMTPEELEALKKDISDGIKSSVLEAMKAAPAPDTTGNQPDIQVTMDEGDRPFKSLADQCKAIKQATVTNGREVDKRLLGVMDKYYKATGASEAIPADGGYLLQPSISTEIIAPMRTEGAFTPYVRKLPVAANSNSGWLNGVDETSRASTRWGGVLGYHVAEAATLTASKPKFRRINWELKKIAVLMYGSDELLADSTQFEAVARQSAGEEINFLVNDDIMNGIGTGGPQGVLKSPALIYVARDTASKVLHVDLVNMWQRLHPQFRKNAKWFINSEVEPQLDQLYFTGTTSVLSPYVSYTPEGVMKIKGKDVVVTEFNPALNAAGDIVLADMSQYLLWEKANVEAASSIHVSFLTDETAFRFIYRCDGQGAYGSALTPYKGTNTQSPFVTLGAATTTAA